jgi:Tfp pilus assembly pilus retraction ATPase PilT
MVTMDDSLLALMKTKTITAEAALEKAIDKEQFRTLVRQQQPS